jgi:hypothetical protein
MQKTCKTPSGWGLQQFLDEAVPNSTYIGVYGTAAGISTLVACGESLDSPLVQNFRSWLISRQEGTGGWTIPILHSKNILTTSTCYVLNALSDMKENFSSPLIQDGLSWLQKTRNPDRGWGYYENDAISRTLPTAHAILSLSRYPEMLRTQTSVEGINWLLKSRNADHGWGLDSKSLSTVGHTSLVILALLAAGYPTYSSDIQEPIEWLLQQFKERPESFHTEIEVYYVHHNDTTATGMHYHIPSLSLSLHALLASGVDPLKNEITTLVRRIVSSQHIGGYWEDDTVQGKIPIWAIMYNCLALREFIKRINAVRETLGIRQAIVDLTQEVHEARTEVIELSSKLEILKRQISPLSNFLLILRKYRIFILVATLALSYIIFLLIFDLPLYINIAAGLLEIVLTVIGLYDSRQNNKD